MNYEMMKQSETELHEQFLKFCDHVTNTWVYVIKIIKSGKANKSDLDKIHVLEEQSNHMEANIQDECIWAISKNQPFANHLRYIISILNSIKDLERMADYAVSTIRYFVNNDGKISQNIRTLLGDSINNATIAIKKIFQALRNKTAMEAYKISTQSDKLFREKYSEGLKQLSTILKNSTVDEIVTLFQNAIIIMKHAERIVDHAINVSENFVFIKQNDFFFDKQNKQFDK